MAHRGFSLTIRTTDFLSPYKAAVVASPPFLGDVEEFVVGVVDQGLLNLPELVECTVSTQNDSPSSPELERLTRDFFRLDIRAFGADWAACLLAHVRLQPSGSGLALRGLKEPLVRSDLYLPGREWLEWFLGDARCPGCATFPDYTDEYLSCHLCKYADYRESVEAAERRFASSREADLVPAIWALIKAAREESLPVRQTYLQVRLHEVWSTPEKARDPLPWGSAAQQ